MNQFFRTLASLELSIILLVSIAVLLSFGTIIESLQGAEAARHVYHAFWFRLLLGLFALNVAAALWERFPRNRWRVGFLITHASLLLILAGSLVTAAKTQEGRLPLWEGESASHFFEERPGRPAEHRELPFVVRLDAFEIDVYPGTQRPAMFRSRVTVRERSGSERPAVIEMNKPLQTGGYRFFQSSYQIEGGREMSILSVSKDPGQAIVFWGYGLLVLGMLIVLATRIVQRRTGAFPGPRAARAALLAAALLGGGLALGSGVPATAQTNGRPTPEQLERLRRLPVQSDGREMPLDTQARDDLRTVTARADWKGMDPVEVVLGWTMAPDRWADEPLVRIDADVASRIGLSEGTRSASYRTLASSEPLRREVEGAMHRQQAEQKPSKADKHLLRLSERLGVLDGYLRGEAIRPIPAPERVAIWSPPQGATTFEAWAAIESQVRPGAPPHYPTARSIDREVRYNAAHPTRIAWFLLLPAAIAAGLSLERKRPLLRWAAAGLTVLGFAVMTWGIATRWEIAGRIPASNMYESMLFLGWGVGLFGVVSVLLRNRMLIFNAAAMAALVMLLLDRLPIDPFIHPMPPVLSGTPWLAIHVPIIMVSYSIFAIATFLAHLVLGAAIFSPSRPDRAERWSDLLYWYMVAGSIFLIAGILTGSIWAASSWGRYWGWDPKEVWSLVAFLAYMAILHARFDGRLGPFGVAAWAIGAFWTILMTYLGVNFVLATGLHSYGFGSSGLVQTMGLIALAEAAFVAAAWRANRRLRPAR